MFSGAVQCKVPVQTRRINRDFHHSHSAIHGASIALGYGHFCGAFATKKHGTLVVTSLNNVVEGEIWDKCCTKVNSFPTYKVVRV